MRNWLQTSAQCGIPLEESSVFEGINVMKHPPSTHSGEGQPKAQLLAPYASLRRPLTFTLKPHPRNMFWRNLNVFIPSFALLLKIVADPLVMLLTVPAMMIFQQDVRIGFVFMPLVGPILAAMLGYRCWRYGLAPRSVNPARSRLHQYGHLILAIASFVAIVLLAFSSLMVPYVWDEWRPAYNPDQRHYESLVGPVSQIVTVAWVVGLLLVFSARARPGTKPALHPGQKSAV